MRTHRRRIGLIDCGAVSRVTRGFANLILYEGGLPPFDRIWLH